MTMICYHASNNMTVPPFFCAIAGSMDESYPLENSQLPPPSSSSSHLAPAVTGTDGRTSVTSLTHVVPVPTTANAMAAAIHAAAASDQVCNTLSHTHTLSRTPTLTHSHIHPFTHAHPLCHLSTSLSLSLHLLPLPSLLLSFYSLTLSLSLGEHLSRFRWYWCQHCSRYFQ